MTWYAYRTAPRREFAVEEILRRHGLDVLCPVETKWKRQGRKKIPTDYPMLPRYLFAAGADPWAVCRALVNRGIVGVVSIDGRPAAIPEASIHRLARMSGGVARSSQAKVHKAFVVGDTAEIVIGPYRGHLVEIKNIKGRAATILLKMFGSEMPVEIGVDQLEAA